MEDSIQFPNIYKNENNILTWHEYFDELVLTGCYAGQYEIINASILYNCNIVIYRNDNFNDDDKNYNFHFETIINQYSETINPFIPIILIGWVNNNHYVLIFPKNYPINLTQNKDKNINNKNIKKESPKKAIVKNINIKNNSKKIIKIS